MKRIDQDSFRFVSIRFNRRNTVPSQYFRPFRFIRVKCLTLSTVVYTLRFVLT